MTKSIEWESPDAPSVQECEMEDDILHDDPDRKTYAQALAASLVGASLDEAEAKIAGIGQGHFAYVLVKDGDRYRFRIRKDGVLGWDTVRFRVDGGAVKEANVGF